MYRSSLLAFVSFIVLVLSLTASSPTRAQLIRVPGDVAGLQQAINQIGNGGTGGTIGTSATYSLTPNGDYSIGDGPGSYTLNLANISFGLVCNCC